MRLFIIILAFLSTAVCNANSCFTIDSKVKEWYSLHKDKLNIQINVNDQRIELRTRIPLTIDDKKFEAIYLVQEDSATLETEIYTTLFVSKESEIGETHTIFLADINKIKVFITYEGCNNYFEFYLKDWLSRSSNK